MNENLMTENSALQGSGMSGESDIEFESSLYKTVEFRMYCFKVLPCSKRFCHDWTNCPFAHPGEKARRRDPRVYKYSGIACPEMKLGHVCPRSVSCPFAHNVFEYWLHPSRYRTQPCNDGPACTRRVCFFAHTLDELRVPTEKAEMDGESPTKDKTCSASSRAFDGLDKILAETAFDNNSSISNVSKQSVDTPTLSDCDDTTSRAEFMLRIDQKQDSRNLFEDSDTTLEYLLQNLKPTSHSSTCASSDSETMALAELEQHHLPYLEQNLNDLLSSSCEERSPDRVEQGGYFINSQASLNLSNNSALESGLHWNGGPPRLFVDRMRRNDVRALTTQSFNGQSPFDLPYDCENYFPQQLVSNESCWNAASTAEPFLLASLLSNFQYF